MLTVVIASVAALVVIIVIVVPTVVCAKRRCNQDHSKPAADSDDNYDGGVIELPNIDNQIDWK